MLASLKKIRARIESGERPAGWDLYQMSVADKVVDQPDGDTHLTLSDAAVSRAAALLTDHDALTVELAKLTSEIVQDVVKRKNRLRLANTILRVKYPILASPEVRLIRYMACLGCEYAGRDAEGGPITCLKCGCGSDTLNRRWRVLDASCADHDHPRWTPGLHFRNE